MLLCFVVGACYGEKSEKRAQRDREERQRKAGL
jgi:hypothetical protein